MLGGLNRYYPLIGGPAEARDEQGDWVWENMERKSNFGLSSNSFPAFSIECPSQQQLLLTDAPQGQSLQRQPALDYIINQLLSKNKKMQIPEQLLFPKTQHRKQESKIISCWAMFLFYLFTKKELLFTQLTPDSIPKNYNITVPIWNILPVLLQKFQGE